MKKLYHGSISDFKFIDLNEGKGYKDFGKGFYATSVKSHAENIAKRNKRFATNKESVKAKRIKGYRKQKYTAYRYNLEFDETCLFNKGLNVKIFEKPDIEWVLFILKNRQSELTCHSYDIVIGPTADENTVTILNNYKEELIKTNYSQKVLLNLIKELRPENLPKQYFFGTQKSFIHSQGRSSCHKECPYNYTEYIIKVFLITEKSDIKLLMNELYRILSYGKIKEK